MSSESVVIGMRRRAVRHGARSAGRELDRDVPRRRPRPSALTRSGRPRASSRQLVALAVALAVLFVIAPATLAGGTYGRSFTDNGSLVDATRTSFAAFWSAGSGDLPPALQSAVDYWQRYHVVKALIAGLLLAVLLVLGTRVGRALSRSDGRDGGKTTALIAAAVGIALSALVAIVLTVANIQGAMAPFASLLSLLGVEQRGGELAATVDQVRQALAQPGATHSAALNAIVDDFAFYHAVFAVVAAALAVCFLVVGVTAWRARRSATVASGGVRRMLGAFGASSIVLALLVLVVALANVSNATAPEEGLRIFFGGV
jgi:hypothetical protein